MKNNVWIISLLVGLVVVLVIGGVSLLVKVNTLSKEYKQETAKNINLEKAIEDLEEERGDLREKIEQLNGQNISLSKTVDDLKTENSQFSSEVKQLKEEVKKLKEEKSLKKEELEEESSTKENPKKQ
jgi:peptidoglycan hydrolase CwlO-like protein